MKKLSWKSLVFGSLSGGGIAAVLLIAVILVIGVPLAFDAERISGAVEGAAYDQAFDQLWASKEYLIFGWAIIIGIITSGVSGFVTAHFAKHAPYLHNGIVLGIGVVINLLFSSGEGPSSFSPLEALLLLGAELFFRYLGLTFAIRNKAA